MPQGEDLGSVWLLLGWKPSPASASHKKTEDFHALLQNFPLLCRFFFYYNGDIQGLARCFESHINQRRQITFIPGGWRAGRGARSTRWASCPGTGPQGSLKRFPLFLSRMPKLEAFVLLPFLQVLPSPIKVILAFIKLRIPPPMENLWSEVPLFSVPRCLTHKKIVAEGLQNLLRITASSARECAAWARIFPCNRVNKLSSVPELPSCSGQWTDTALVDAGAQTPSMRTLPASFW